MTDSLAARAAAAGIAIRYRDNTGREREVPPETLEACLAAMGPVARQERPVPAWWVSVAGRRPGLALAPDLAWHVEIEGGGEREGRGGPLPALPMGRHRLMAGEAVCWILSAPAALPLPPRGWGITVPLYGLRGPGRGGLGDYTDLAEAARGLAATGADFLGINPVHAGFAAGSGLISPYTPSHRRRLSTAHLYVPGEAGTGGGAGGDLIDYPAALTARRAALEAAFAAGPDDPGFADYLAEEGAALARFALFEALAERHGPTWDAWPAAVRDPGSEEVARFAARASARVRFHAWLQYLAHGQLRDAGAAAKAAGMAQGLYLDLAVGTHPHGAETWGEREAFAYGVSLGAPPDAFAEGGQNWSLAPFNPRALEAQGFAALAGTLRAQLRYAGMLRIDHILGFERAFWVPGGGLPGTYVTMPKAAMLAVVRIEAARAGAVIVGEDLGNVPEGLDADLAASRILGCQLTMFETGRAAGRYRARALASFGTHDLPTWRGWRAGRDIDARFDLGSIDRAAAADARAARAGEVARLDARIGAAEPGDVDAMHAFLGRSRARLVALQAEDILGVEDQPNLPGTVDEYPNWRRRLPVDARDLGSDPRMQAAGRVMAQTRGTPKDGATGARARRGV